MEDGSANYDIAIDSGEEEANSDNGGFNLGVNLIEVNELDFIYDDRQLGFFMALADLNLRGSGDFSAEVYDLLAAANVNIARLDYEGTNYLNNKMLVLDSRINVDMGQMKFALEKSEITLNDFAFGLDGYMAMPNDDIAVDLSFAGRDNSFKSILSLVPGIYTDSFRGLETSGSMDFKGFIKIRRV